MKAIKKINNNVCQCVDSSGRSLIAFGKGIGFPTMPYELNDMSLVERTYYDVDENFLPMLTEIPLEVLEVARAVSDLAHQSVKSELNPNLTFTLADHINFCLERLRKNIFVTLPPIYDIALSYPVETEVAKKAVELINRSMNVRLRASEATGIAMNIINAEVEPSRPTGDYNEEVLTEDIISIIEKAFGVGIDRSSYNFARLATHLRYLYERLHLGTPIQTNYSELYLPIKKEYPKTEDCVCKIASYLEAIWKCPVDDNERLFLWLHIDRLMTRQGEN